jgi:NADH-quinone oxidoreductase subunit J
MSDIVFCGLGLGAVVSAVVLVTRRNPVYAALSMMVLFGCTALLFLQLAAPFLAAMQVLVYGGAVLMLFLFTLMLLNLHPDEMGGEKGLTFKLSAAILVTVLAIFLVYAVKFSPGLTTAEGFKPPASKSFGTTAHVGQEIFDSYLLPFELVSVLIVVAIAGAVVLTKKKI